MTHGGQFSATTKAECQGRQGERLTLNCQNKISTPNQIQMAKGNLRRAGIEPALFRTADLF